MSQRFTGGCLCGGIRYEADGPPVSAGYCFCADCRHASGSAFIPFMLFTAETVRITGEARQHRAVAYRGGEAVRNFCPACGGLVYGGVVGVDQQHTIYAGSLDDPALFSPKIAIFGRDRPSWAIIPDDVLVFDAMPG